MQPLLYPVLPADYSKGWWTCSPRLSGRRLDKWLPKPSWPGSGLNSLTKLKLLDVLYVPARMKSKIVKQAIVSQAITPILRLRWLGCQKTGRNCPVPVLNNTCFSSAYSAGFRIYHQKIVRPRVMSMCTRHGPKL